MNKPYYLLALLLFCAPALAQVDTAPPTEPEAGSTTQPAVGVTYITVHEKQMAPEDIFDDIAKQAGVHFSDPNGMGSDAMSDPIDFDADHQPFWQVMHDLCAKVNVQPYNSGSRNSKRIALQSFNRDFKWGSLPYAVVDGCLVQATMFNRSQSVQYGSTRPPQDNTTVQLSIYADPSMHMPAFRSMAKATEAVDDAGNSMIPPAKGNPTFYEGYNSGQGLMGNANVLLSYPPKAGKKIESLKVNLLCRAAMEVKTLTFDKLDQPQTLSTDEMEITVKSLKTTKVNNQNDRYSLTVQVDSENRNDIYNLLQNGQLLDAKGHAFASEGGSGGGGGNGTYTYTVSFMTNRGGDDDAATGQPAKWVLGGPTKIRTITLPVELKDLPLP